MTVRYIYCGYFLLQYFFSNQDSNRRNRIMLQIGLALLLIVVTATAKADLCADKTHKDGDVFEVGTCEAKYYTCVGGAQVEMPCGTGTVFDPACSCCQYMAQVESCKNVEFVDCSNPTYNNNNFEYTKESDCENGVYYHCVGGVETMETCPKGLKYDPVLKQCTTSADCEKSSIGTVAPDPIADAEPEATAKPSNTSPISAKTTTSVASGTSVGSATTTVGSGTSKKTTTSTAATNLCADGTHKNYETFPESDCNAKYYQCIDGQQLTRECATGTVFDQDTGLCLNMREVDACRQVVPDCTDPTYNGNSYAYTKPEDCVNGTYYQCQGGVEEKKSCENGQYYDSERTQCSPINRCDEISIGTESTTTTANPDTAETTTTATNTEGSTIAPTTTASSGSATTTTESTTTSANTADPGSASSTTTEATTVSDTSTTSTTSETTPEPVPPELMTTSVSGIGGTESTTTTANPDTAETTTTATNTDGSTVETDKPDETTVSNVITETTVSTTTTSTAQPAGPTYVGFVVDDTGSMSTEIVAVRDWIESCVSGTISSCGDEPTGGWIITSFNDPYVNRVVGPTLNTDDIISEASSYYAHGGGDCPEMAFSGLRNAARAVPDVNGGCKMYFFTDATAADDSLFDSVNQLYQDKGCAFIPILTGCCGTCPDACESTSDTYCEDHVTDSSASSSYRTAERSTAYSSQTLFYVMSEETGGNVYVTDKPSSPDDMLDFLEEEVTLGFCASTVIAGPSPDGYQCEEDCLLMNMCWDRSVSKCYCNGTIPCAHDPIKPGYSKCAGEQEVICLENEINRVEADNTDCSSYFQCNSGDLYHFTCANGTIYSESSTSHCDHPENVEPPCGTLGVVEA